MKHVECIYSCTFPNTPIQSQAKLWFPKVVVYGGGIVTCSKMVSGVRWESPSWCFCSCVLTPGQGLWPSRCCDWFCSQTAHVVFKSFPFHQCCSFLDLQAEILTCIFYRNVTNTKVLSVLQTLVKPSDSIRNLWIWRSVVNAVIVQVCSQNKQNLNFSHVFHSSHNDVRQLFVQLSAASQRRPPAETLGKCVQFSPFVRFIASPRLQLWSSLRYKQFSAAVWQHVQPTTLTCWKTADLYC